MATEINTLLTTRRFRVVEVAETLPDGKVLKRSVIRHPGSVVVVPLVGDRQVCLIRNFRVAVDRVLIELPAGTLEPNEDPQECAARELLEETGYRAQRVRLMHAFYAAPGILDENMRLFVADGLVEEAAAREVGEQIENLVVDWDDALSMIYDGRIEDAKTIVGLLYYDGIRRGVQSPRLASEK